MLSNSDFQETVQKENMKPVLEMESTEKESKLVQRKSPSKLCPLAPRQSNIAVVSKVKKGIPRPGPRTASKLPRSKNTEKTFSAFSSVSITDNPEDKFLLKIEYYRCSFCLHFFQPINAAAHDHHQESLKNNNQQATGNSQMKNFKSVEKSGKRKSQQLTVSYC